MRLTAKETLFLTALVREQNQSGCRGPAHDLLRQHAYPDAPRTGAGSLAFSYEAVPLTSLLLMDFPDLQAIDDFVRRGEPEDAPEWPWETADEFRARLREARRFWEHEREAARAPPNGTGGPGHGLRSVADGSSR
jgi:hypothetical protein